MHFLPDCPFLLRLDNYCHSNPMGLYTQVGPTILPSHHNSVASLSFPRSILYSIFFVRMFLCFHTYPLPSTLFRLLSSMVHRNFRLILLFLYKLNPILIRNYPSPSVHRNSLDAYLYNLLYNLDIQIRVASCLLPRFVPSISCHYNCLLPYIPTSGLCGSHSIHLVLVCLPSL